MFGNPFSALSVPEHMAGTGLEIPQDGTEESGLDPAGIGPDEGSLTGGYGFMAVGVFPGDNAGDSEEGGFFLHAPGVGEDGEGGAEHLGEDLGGQRTQQE